MARQKELADKRLLQIEVFICIISSVFLLAMLLLAVYINIPDWLRFVLIGTGFVQFVPAMLLALRIEQVAGYYKCAKCGHKYIPTYLSVNKAMHFGRKRYMKCPECGRKSWQSKVISKSE